MKHPGASENLALWVEKGMPYPEVRSRISERTERDCQLARAWLREAGMFPAGATEKLLRFAAVIHGGFNTTRLLEKFEPVLLERVPTSMRTSANFQQFLEVHALAVEAIMRDFKRNPTS